jgi:hypothetical protein
MSCVFRAIHTGQSLNDKQLVFIVNEYKNKVILNMTGQNAVVIDAYGGKERLYELPDSIKVRTESGVYHSSINKELDKVKQAAKQYPIFQATITILNTGNPISFDYYTDIQKSLAQKVYDTRNITSVINYIFSNQQHFQKTALQLNLIQHSGYIGSSNSKTALPISMLESEIYKKASEAVQNKASEDDFIKSILEAINITYHRMKAQWDRGSVQFSPIQGIIITPELLNSLLDRAR